MLAVLGEVGAGEQAERCEEPLAQRLAQPVRVLVVDDEPMLRETLGNMLSDEGYVVDLAVDGEDALDRVHQFRPDAILLLPWLCLAAAAILLPAFIATGRAYLRRRRAPKDDEEKLTVGD